MYRLTPRTHSWRASWLATSEDCKLGYNPKIDQTASLIANFCANLFSTEELAKKQGQAVARRGSSTRGRSGLPFQVCGAEASTFGVCAPEPREWAYTL